MRPSASPTCGPPPLVFRRPRPHVLSPPYRMEGEQIEHDMGELVPSPVVVHAAIVGFGQDDRVIELIEYPAADVVPPDPGDPR